MSSNFTLNELTTQIDAWQDALQTVIRHREAITTLWKQGEYDYVVFTGCGSTHYLALSAANFMQATTGIVSRAVPASELLFHADSIYALGKKPLLVAISRSGTTTETVRAAQLSHSDVLVLSCYDDKPLNKEAKFTLAAKAGQEKSVAQTRSWSAMMVLAEGFARTVAGMILQADMFAKDSTNEAKQFASFYSNPLAYHQYFYLGSGPRYGIAAEAMLKMKEVSLTHAEAYHVMEFRHGPMSMVDQDTVVIGLLDSHETAYPFEKAVLDEMRQIGARVVEISDHPDADFVIQAGSLVRYLPIAQWLAYHRAVAKGLNPDQPRNLTQVIDLKDALNALEQ